MIELIQNGNVTSPLGFLAGGTYAGLKAPGDEVLDMGVLISESQASIAATFTTNNVPSPSVVLSKERAVNDTAMGVIANSGSANCCVGSQGYEDAKEMSALAGAHLGVNPEDILVCSTGVIGVELPMALIRQNMGNIKTTSDGGHDFAKAIMTTDTRSKELAISFDLGGKKVTIGGAAKGAGMIHPNMATMLAFITTDASVGKAFLQKSLGESVGQSFNMIDIDNDQSTNDTVLALANGKSGADEIDENSPDSNAFKEGLTYVCVELAKEIVRDAEGAQRVMEVAVEGALSIEDAAKAAREISSSMLVKTMLHGGDPNWGRLMMAIGKSGIKINESKIDIYINEIQIVHEGQTISFFKDAVVSAMNAPEVKFGISLNVGDASATAWGCDLTEEYVVFNSAYST
ncbi:MAG: bifunctional glutamate N-acetyltransferase/amino-acid acetyltransferase ArgJ [Dehalococcoidia bacterium]|nr:bifunctional ornithine acetyltransferase/N-acetylglutamate synthase [Chloroflexota bacterium]|tara:strand:+ start:695 stop:1903 length:1209 start_codon:yes stop_codon:yes gene_type:complete